MLQHLTCKNCGAPRLDSESDGRVVCGYCGAEYAAAGTLCPACDHVNAQSAAFCSACGEPLTRRCPACEHANWSGAEYCAGCGRAMDILEVMR